MTFSYYTVLSNWLLGYDRYQRSYSKHLIAQSSFPKEFYLLSEEDSSIGITKAQNLLQKISIPQNKLLKIETSLNVQDLLPNLRNGKGKIFPDSQVPVSKVFLQEAGKWIEFSVEEITAQAYLLENTSLKDYQDLQPRTLSILPVAMACQARCWFCFSESSISSTKEKFLMDTSNLQDLCQKARARGAERFVITGGGEPGLLKFENLLEIIKIAKVHFEKIVLITNGLFLSIPKEEVRKEKLEKMIEAGLTTLCVSRHSPTPDQNKMIMGIDTKSEVIWNTIQSHKLNLRTRLICVLQKQGVKDQESIGEYLTYASLHKIDEVCFKELYVASSLESLYSHTKENKYSESSQVALKEVLSFMIKNEFQKTMELPWGSPVYSGNWQGHNLKIAAYTEPSVGWERINGVARSWNLMADGKCYASLEDLSSEIKE